VLWSAEFSGEVTAAVNVRKRVFGVTGTCRPSPENRVYIEIQNTLNIGTSTHFNKY
jgi:hypothetical protein